MAAPPIPSNPDASRKRGRDPTDLTAGQTPAKRSYALGDVVFRVVLPAKQIGRVIGKQGAKVQAVRAATGATIKIADAFNPLEERVIIISSRSLGDGSSVSSAEIALCAIARLVLKEAEVTNTIRLLITGSQVGSLIGISGQNIEQIRHSSGATVSVLAQSQLPSCASALESDRVVQVSGNVPQVLSGLEKIGCILRENPPKEVISIKPRYNYGLTLSNPPPYMPLPQYLPPPVPPLSYVPPPVPPPPSVDNVTSEMMIMEKLVGGLIGKNGYNISKIRIESGATIKVSGVKGEGDQRLIQFSGSSFQVALARSMVDSYIFSQLLPQNPL